MKNVYYCVSVMKEFWENVSIKYSGIVLLPAGQNKRKIYLPLHVLLGNNENHNDITTMTNDK